MKIKRSRNGNRSLRNDHLLFRYVYSDILNRIRQKKSVSPGKFRLVKCVTLSLPHTKFSGVFVRRTATGSKAVSLVISLDSTTFVSLLI